MTTALWAALAAIALLWPARLAGPFDGAPLDAALEASFLAIAVAVAWMCPAVLRHRLVRGAVVGMLLWKAGTAATLVQDGWCLRFTSPVALTQATGQIPHSWDIRADWRSPVPRCSAVMSHGYSDTEFFPAWFYNLPPADPGEPARPSDRPPNVTLRLDLEGSLHADAAGVLQVAHSPQVRPSAIIDGVPISAESLAAGVAVEPGPHHVALNATLVESGWRLEPRWNGTDLWRAGTATMTPVSEWDRWIRPWGRFVPALIVLVMAGGALAAVAQRTGGAQTAILAAGISLLMAGLALIDSGAPLRAAPLLLLAAAVLPLPRRSRNIVGASLLVGLPFVVMFMVVGLPRVGVFTWYSSGDDWWEFQRFAYRIFMEGYWLEGGEPTFWFQPFYRWIAGSLHLLFGDSSVGELYWDAGAVAIGSAFAFHVTRACAGFRWGIVAAVVTIATYTTGPAWYLFGRGLSELSSMGLLYAAALFAIRGRRGYAPAVVAAGVLASLAFYTRLNNLPIALMVAAFALPVAQPIGGWWRPQAWLPRASRPVLAGVLGGMAVGLWLFCARTWYYTGQINLLHGTQANHLSAWQAQDTWVQGVQHLAESVAMVLTMSDPPSLDPRALPIVAGTVAALLGVAGVRPFTGLPMNAALLCLSGLVGSLVSRGTAYPGRFTVHLVPVTVALTMCAVALVVRSWRAAKTPVAMP
jgi:hypothetical protein